MNLRDHPERPYDAIPGNDLENGLRVYCHGLTAPHTDRCTPLLFGDVLWKIGKEQRRGGEWDGKLHRNPARKNA